MRVIKQTCQYCDNKRLVGKFMYDTNLGQICDWCYMDYLKENLPENTKVIAHLESEVGSKKNTDISDEKKELSKWTQKLRQAHKNKESLKQRRNIRIKRDNAGEALREKRGVII